MDMFYTGVHFVRAKCKLIALIMLQRRFIVHLTQYLAELLEVMVLKKSSFSCPPCLLYVLEACPVNKPPPQKKKDHWNQFRNVHVLCQMLADF